MSKHREEYDHKVINDLRLKLGTCHAGGDTYLRTAIMEAAEKLGSYRDPLSETEILRFRSWMDSLIQHSPGQMGETGRALLEAYERK